MGKDSSGVDLSDSNGRCTEGDIKQVKTCFPPPPALVRPGCGGEDGKKAFSLGTWLDGGALTTEYTS